MKGKVIFILIGLIGLFFMGAFVHNSNKKEDEAEIIQHEYYSLLLKYDYLKGSDAGKDFNKKIADYFKDGVITNKEYKRLTGDNPKQFNFAKPEAKKLEENAKDKLIAQITN